MAQHAKRSPMSPGSIRAGLLALVPDALACLEGSLRGTRPVSGPALSSAWRVLELGMEDAPAPTARQVQTLGNVLELVHR
jgi:hypothetical protein